MADSIKQSLSVIIMNSLLFNLQYGVKRFKQFKKRLILDYKKGDKHAHTNPHALSLQLKQQLLHAKKGGDWKKIRELERNSLTPYGRFAKHGFIFQKDKLPNYDIPNIEGFQLQPYVEYLTPKLDSLLLGHQKRINEEKMQKLKQAELLPPASNNIQTVKK